MSSNRLIYDNCAYAKKIDESTSPLNYVLNPMKYENCKKCRNELGLVGGTAVSHIKGNMVDLENDLRGSTRLNSLCPSKKFPNATYKDGDRSNIVISGKSCGKLTTVNTDMVHLPACQMIQYNRVPMPSAMKLESCPSPSLESRKPCQTN